MLAEPPAQQATEHLAEYEIESVLGHGSCGLVYLVRSLENGEPYAIKQFPATREQIQAFYREVSILFTLNHPNIVRCLNLIYGQSSRNYLVFEYANNGNLRSILEKECELPPARVIDILKQITSGLAHAHGQQIVHRDLKPENILVHCCGNGRTTYKIGDLGVAYRLDAAELPVTSNGSPAYMAPEQFYDRPCAASDLYSLGVMIYEMLTGRRPFSGGPERLFSAHNMEPPDLERIEHEGTRELVRDLMEKDPAKRLASADELLCRLDLLSGNHGHEPPRERPRHRVQQVNCAYFHGDHRIDLKLRTHHPAPGAVRLLAPEGWHQPRLWVVDDRSTDMIDLRSGRRITQHFATPVQVAAPTEPHHESVYYACAQYVYYRDLASGAHGRHFAHQIKIRNLLADVARHRLIYASDSRVFSSAMNGRLQWQFNCENYFIKPQLTVLADGTLLATSGPASASVIAVDVEGRERFRHACAGPVLAVGPLEAAESYFLVVQDLERGQQSWLHICQGAQSLHRLPLSSGVHGVSVMQGLLSLLRVDGIIDIYATSGDLVGSADPGAPVLDNAWIPSVGCYAVLTEGERCTNVIIYDVEASMPHTSLEHRNDRLSSTTLTHERQPHDDL